MTTLSEPVRHRWHNLFPRERHFLLCEANDLLTFCSSTLQWTVPPALMARLYGSPN